MPHLFEPFTQKSLTLKNRTVVAPMCMYSAQPDGLATEWHLVHYGTRAMGGVGMIIAEATAVEPRGRITVNDLGLWNDEQAVALERVVKFCQAQGSAFSIQLAHAGRKAWSNKKGQGPERAVAPSAIPYDSDWECPEALDLAGIDRIVTAFGEAARRAGEIGCDSVEIHAAHGYLIYEFLSPLSNQRTDEYGGSLENRSRFLKRVYEAVRANFPAERPVWVRLSATEWVEGGWEIEQSIALSKMMKEWGVDLIDVSTGGNSPLQQIEGLGPNYQVPFADRIRREVGIPTGAVGLITEAHQADEIVQSGKADVVLLAREYLRNPYFTLEAAHVLGHEITWPEAYLRGRFPKR